MIVLIFAVVGATITTFDLTSNSVSWGVSNANGSIQVAADVPGYIHTDLLAAGVIGDPRYRFNDAYYQWVALDNWTYTTTFTLPTSVSSQSAIMLLLDGLDTVAAIELDGVGVAVVENMFRRYVFNVTALLQSSTLKQHTLSIAFTSAVTAADARAAAYPYPVPASQSPGSIRTVSTHNFLRKEQDSDR
jgi:beta-mannosidase